MANRQDYLIRRELRKEKKTAAGLISEKFPNVSSILINLIYSYELSGKVYLERSLNFSPSDSAYFNMECFSKNCTSNGFELVPVVKKLIKAHKRTGRGKLICKVENNPKDIYSNGNIHISYKIDIKYSRRSSSHKKT